MSLTNFALEKDIQPEQIQSDLELSTDNENNNAVCARTGESGMQARFRVNRLFAVGIDWYFSTREGKDRGPFKAEKVQKQPLQNSSQKYKFRKI